MGMAPKVNHGSAPPSSGSRNGFAPASLPKLQFGASAQLCLPRWNRGTMAKGSVCLDGGRLKMLHIIGEPAGRVKSAVRELMTARRRRCRRLGNDRQDKHCQAQFSPGNWLLCSATTTWGYCQRAFPRGSRHSPSCCYAAGRRRFLLKRAAGQDDPFSGVHHVLLTYLQERFRCRHDRYATTRIRCCSSMARLTRCSNTSSASSNGSLDQTQQAGELLRQFHARCGSFRRVGLAGRGVHDCPTVPWRRTPFPRLPPDMTRS